jgi:hypothetical protein
MGLLCPAEKFDILWVFFSIQPLEVNCPGIINSELAVLDVYAW